MPNLSEKVVITPLNANKGRINFGNKYVINKEPGGKKGHWSEHLISLIALTPLKDKKEKTNVFRHQERSYDSMKLSLSRDTSFTNSLIKKSSNSMRTQNTNIFIEPYVERKLSKTGSLASLSDDSHSYTDSEKNASNCYLSSSDSCSLSSSEFGSVSDINEKQKSETTRIVERFGDGFRDKCLFPLSLSLDLTDLTKGKITWESINSKADLVLDKWCSQYSRKVNRVLSSASDFVCPEPSLESRMLLKSKKNHKPLKRWNSNEDLYSVSRQKISSKNWTPLSATDDALFSRHMTLKLTKKQSTNDYQKRKASVRSNDSNELILLQPISSPLFVKTSSLVQKPIRIEAKSLLKNIRANSPLSLALYVTEIDKQYFLRLKDKQVFDCMLGVCDLNQKNSDLIELQDILEFGTELNKFVVSVIRKQITPENQGIKIAGFIEVACILRKLRNWHSLVNVIRALQSPKIYFMEEAWMSMKKAFPIHFNDYIKLCRLVRLNQTCIIGSTIGSSIPSLASLLSKLSIHCIATWDLMESKRRWTEQPSMAGWVDNELIGQLVESQKLRQKQEEIYMLSLGGNKYSLLPDNDPIRLISNASLPKNWTQKDIKYITNSYKKSIVNCFATSFQKERHLIRHYTIPTAYT